MNQHTRIYTFCSKFLATLFGDKYKLFSCLEEMTFIPMEDKILTSVREITITPMEDKAIPIEEVHKLLE